MYDEIAPPGAKALLVCSTGGHLSELLRVEERMGRNPDSLWVTFDNNQSRDLLQGRRVAYLPYIGPRGLRSTVSSLPALRRIVRRERFDVAVSTGAAVATSALPVARLAGIPAVYVESVTRVNSPSTTGRLLRMVPGIDLRTQHPALVDRRWRLTRSILSDFRREATDTVVEARRPLKLFVTLGTIRGFRFDSAVEAALASGYADENTVWQLGHTTRDDLPGRVHTMMAPHELAEAAAEADVVITHSGVGTLLELLSLGIYPLQVVRRASRNEHVDDHQAELAELVNRLDVGRAVETTTLSAADIEYVASQRVLDALHVAA